MTIAIILAALMLIYFIACYIIFDMAIVRHKEITTFDEETIRNSSFWGKSADSVIQGRRWLNSMPQEIVHVQSNDGLSLRGRYIDNPVSRGTLILCHGYRSEAFNDMGGGAPFYYQQGFSLLLIDQRSHQGSQGKYITFGVLEKDDISSWVDWVIQRKGLNERIVLAGLSMGASTVLMSLGIEHRENIKCAIADCGFTSPWAIISKVSNTDYHIPFPLVGYGVDMFCQGLAHFSLKGYSTIKGLESSSVPVLFIHGKDDSFVPYQMTLDAYQSYQGPKSILLVDGADHGLSFTIEPKKYKKALEELFQKYVP